MSLNTVLHDMAHAIGMNLSHPVHDEIDKAVPPEKDEEKGEEEDTNAEE